MTESTFLGHLLTPELRNRIALRRELERRRDAWTHDTYYKGAGDLLIRHGKPYVGQVIPDEFLRWQGPPSNCYLNSLAAASGDPRLTYCEGIFSAGVGHYTSHAWCIYNGQVVDVTMPTRETDKYHQPLGPSQTSVPMLPPAYWGYWGVTFQHEYVRAVGNLPLLDRPAEDSIFASDGIDTKDDRTAWPVLEKHWYPNRTTL